MRNGLGTQDPPEAVPHSRSPAVPHGRYNPPMRLLLIGGGGREHALAWKLTREDPDLELIAAPANPGIAELGECVPINVLDIDALERLSRENASDLTVRRLRGALRGGPPSCSLAPWPCYLRHCSHAYLLGPSSA